MAQEASVAYGKSSLLPELHHLPTPPGCVPPQVKMGTRGSRHRSLTTPPRRGGYLGLFQETGLHDTQGMVHMENQRRHHCYHAFLGIDPTAAPAAVVRAGLLIALRADVFAAEVRDVVDIIPGKAKALDVGTAGATVTVIYVHGPGSGGNSWACKASFWANMACMYVGRPR